MFCLDCLQALYGVDFDERLDDILANVTQLFEELDLNFGRKGSLE
jgi:hypothetical protein